MNIEKLLTEEIVTGFAALFEHSLPVDSVKLSPTPKEFEGVYTFVTFPYSKITRKKPEETADILGKYLCKHSGIVADFNVVKGFLNLVIADTSWVRFLKEIWADDSFGFWPPNGEKIMVEYSSPNTNKPIHLGHLRNIFIGFSISEILKANGYDVFRVNLINDRGIHICKSMLAYEKLGNHETPASSGIKGDHLIGKYYVKFDQRFKEEIEDIINEEKANLPALQNIENLKEYRKKLRTGAKKEKLSEEEKNLLKIIDNLYDTAEKKAPIMLEAQEMLRKWEEGDPTVIALWKKMNSWVYDGFEQTYKQMGVSFDKFYYESDTYLLGKDIVDEGLAEDIFYQKTDKSVWVDLTDDGLDQKLLLRPDGTSVYITQDLGTADMKYHDFPFQKSIYVVGNEQDYHFKVLFEILRKLGRSYADGLYHLSYGMVDLPSGKMKSREGTVVDADQLMEEMIATAKEKSQAAGKIDMLTTEEAESLYEVLGIGALKYFLLKVDPKKRILFDPEESIDFQGNTAPFIQYTHARISAIMRRAKKENIQPGKVSLDKLSSIDAVERELIFLLSVFPHKVKEAADEYAPAIIAQYLYDLAKSYNRFFAELSIFNENNLMRMNFRVTLSASVAKVISRGMTLLGIEVPERM